ncbi:MAG: LPXTG cell wall anchor domain-containing protein [Rhodoluna sp.]
MRKLLVITLSAAVIAALPLSSAQAEVDYGVHVYMSAPKVQGTPLTNNFTTETFDAFEAGALPTALSIGTVNGTGRIDDGGDYGGASSSTSIPVTGGVSSRYMTTFNNANSELLPIAIDLASPAKYLGLWWSAGSPSNQVKFFSGDQEVASMTTAALMTKLSAPTQSAKDGTTTYTSTDYFGNPVNNGASGEPFVYLNVYAIGGTSFDRVELSGGGFEFDNITVSDLENEPASSLVDVEFIPGLFEPVVEDTENETTDTGTEETLADTGADTSALGFGALGLMIAGALALAVSRFRRRA